MGWNAYAEDQRGVVWTRLSALRAGATAHVLEIVDATTLGGAAPQGLDGDPHLQAYEALRRHAGHRRPAAPLLERLGLRLLDPAFAGAVEDLLLLIDQEFYLRSLAAYERNYRTLAR